MMTAAVTASLRTTESPTQTDESLCNVTHWFTIILNNDAIYTLSVSLCLSLCVCLSVCLSVSLSVSLHFNGHFPRRTQVSKYQNVSILDFVGAKGNGMV